MLAILPQWCGTLELYNRKTMPSQEYFSSHVVLSPSFCFRSWRRSLHAFLRPI